jgi:hypothetical protein
MFAYLMFRQFDAIIFFGIIGIISSYFSKNMIVILLIALVSTNLAISIKMIGKVKEGLENMQEEETKEGYSKPGNKKKLKKLTKAEQRKNSEEQRKKVAEEEKKREGGRGRGKEPAGQGVSKGKINVKDGFTQQLNPARVNAMSDNEDEDDFSGTPSVNYASTLEAAYDNLDKLLSSDAISKMSDDTHRLAEKQQMLMGNIEKLSPMIQKAGSMLEGLNMEGMSDMLGGLTTKLSSLGVTKGK